ncbi:hypothetical protein [Sagittula sp. S175]|uniref:hypothetical protein n=1 Tax=Sagittula sp. S175 TaxID=3415129 RepID=UPI003C7EAED4
MAKRTPSAAVRKRILAAIREVEGTGAVKNQTVLKHLQDNGQGASMSDVQAIVKEYREEAEAHAATMSAVPPMPDEVIEMNEKMWSLIWKKADEPVAAIKAHYATELEKRKVLDEERDSDMLVVEADLEAAIIRAEKAESELAEVKENLIAARMEIARLEGRLAERLTFSFRPFKDVHEETSEESLNDLEKVVAASTGGVVSCSETHQLDMFGEETFDTTSDAGSNDIAAE